MPASTPLPLPARIPSRSTKPPPPTHSILLLILLHDSIIREASGTTARVVCSPANTANTAAMIPNPPSKTLLDSITIGVELEMVLANLPPHMCPYDFVRGALDPLTPVGRKLHPPKSYFDIKSDPSILPHLIHSHPLEITTPIMTSHTWPHLITTLCRTLQTSTSSLGASILFNPTTALHVHIGLGRPYTLPELKSISKAIIIFELRMDALHPDCRNPADDTFPLHIRRCRSSPRLRRLTEVQKIELIDGASSLEALLCIINASPNGRDAIRYYRYNLLSVLKFGTVEFRQAMGTADPRWIENWVGVVVRFVVAAIETPESCWEKWAREGVRDMRVFDMFGAPRPGKEEERRRGRGRIVPMRWRLSKRRKRIFLSKGGKGG